jgi:hypothetical protein
MKTITKIFNKEKVMNITILDKFFSCEIARNGQVEPYNGNDVVVKMTVTHEKLLSFDDRFFLYSPSLMPISVEKVFSAKTWKLAFDKAVIYFNEQSSKYQKYIDARSQALIDAEN